MKVYHFVNEQYGLQNIQQRRLKVARLGNLNDPFEWMARASSQAERWALRATKEAQARNTGMLCFSTSWRNPVQWSHYADHHRGICLGFEVPENMLKGIKYQKTPLIFDRQKLKSDPIFAQDFMERLLSTKFADWQYEREMRLFVRLDTTTEVDGLYYYNFSDDLKLSDIVVGSEGTTTRRQICEVLGDLAGQVTPRKARLSFKTYRIVEQKMQQFWD